MRSGNLLKSVVLVFILCMDKEINATISRKISVLMNKEE